MKDQHTNNAAGIVYRIVWYVMILILALVIVLQQLQFDQRTPDVVSFLTHLYLGLIPIALLSLAVVLTIKKAHVSSAVAGLLFSLWIVLRFLIT